MSRSDVKSADSQFCKHEAAGMSHSPITTPVFCNQGAGPGCWGGFSLAVPCAGEWAGCAWPAVRGSPPEPPCSPLKYLRTKSCSVPLHPFSSVRRVRFPGGRAPTSSLSQWVFSFFVTVTPTSGCARARSALKLRCFLMSLPSVKRAGLMLRSTTPEPGWTKVDRRRLKLRKTWMNPKSLDLQMF